jgi:Glucose / Sorbosone dehydrogenase
MAFDPFSGKLWLQENGDDTFSELNLVEPGMNDGWVQIAGPVERIAQFKQIETSNAIDPITMSAYFGLQQVRWPPTLIATRLQKHCRVYSCSLAHITVIQNLAGSLRSRRQALDFWTASPWDRDTRETYSWVRPEHS